MAFFSNITSPIPEKILPTDILVFVGAIVPASPLVPSQIAQQHQILTLCAE